MLELSSVVLDYERIVNIAGQLYCLRDGAWIDIYTKLVIIHGAKRDSGGVIINCRILDRLENLTEPVSRQDVYIHDLENVILNHRHRFPPNSDDMLSRIKVAFQITCTKLIDEVTSSLLAYRHGDSRNWRIVDDIHGNCTELSNVIVPSICSEINNLHGYMNDTSDSMQTLRSANIGLDANVHISNNAQAYTPTIYISMNIKKADDDSVIERLRFAKHISVV